MTASAPVNPSAGGSERVIVLVKMISRDGLRERLIEAMDPMLRAVEAEHGVVEYLLLADKADATVLWVYEIYADQAALDAHKTHPALAHTQAAIRPLLAIDYEVRFLEERGGKERG